MGTLSSDWINQQSKAGILSLEFEECLKHACCVAITASTRIVLGICNDDWTARASKLHRSLNRILGRQ